MTYNLAAIFLASVVATATQAEVVRGDPKPAQASSDFQDSGCTAADRGLIARQMDQLAAIYGGTKDAPGVLSAAGWGEQLLNRCTKTIVDAAASKNLMFIALPDKAVSANAQSKITDR